MERNSTINTLNDLIETCKDGELGFRAVAQRLTHPDTRRLMEMRSEACGRAASELQALVGQMGGHAETGGSLSGAAHRGWTAAKDALTGHSDLAMLEEAERGEDVAVARYRDALEEDLPPDARQLIERQFEGVLRNHAQVRELRDQARARQSV